MAERNKSKLVSSVIMTDESKVRSKFRIAVYTHPRSEKKAAAESGKLGMETYKPIQWQPRMWSDHNKSVNGHVIPMTIFVFTSNDGLPKINSQSQIIKILSPPGGAMMRIKVPNWDI